MTRTLPHSAPPPRPFQDFKRQAIQDAVVQLMCREGLDSLTMERVAQEAGVAKGTLYLQTSPTNRLLLEAVKDGALDPMMARMDETSDSVLSRSAAADVRPPRSLFLLRLSGTALRILPDEREVHRRGQPLQGRPRPAPGPEVIRGDPWPGIEKAPSLDRCRRNARTSMWSSNFATMTRSPADRLGCSRVEEDAATRSLSTPSSRGIVEKTPRKGSETARALLSGLPWLPSSPAAWRPRDAGIPVAATSTSPSVAPVLSSRSAGGGSAISSS